MVLSEDEKSDTEDKEEAELGVMEDQRSVILHLISQLKLGMDLTKVGRRIPLGSWPVVWVPSLSLPGSSSFPCGETGKAEGTSSELQPSLAIPGITGKEIHAHPQSVRLAICFLARAVTLQGRGAPEKALEMIRKLQETILLFPAVS